MTKVSPMNSYKLRKPQRVYLTWALSFLLSFVNQLKTGHFDQSGFQWKVSKMYNKSLELASGH